MNFTIKNTQENPNSLARKIGYQPLGISNDNEYEMARELGGSGRYPRFHIFVKRVGKEFVFNLHLDQKKPSYAGSHAHSGEYEGPVIEDEADRIKNILTGQKNILL